MQQLRLLEVFSTYQIIGFYRKESKKMKKILFFKRNILNNICCSIKLSQNARFIYIYIIYNF